MNTACFSVARNAWSSTAFVQTGSGHACEQVLWALCVYVEAVSVLPQLRMMQKAKVRDFQVLTGKYPRKHSTVSWVAPFFR
jgi:hypothetical protein